MKPLLLALDTTHEFGSLALCRGNELLEEMPLHAPNGFSHILYAHLGDLLKRHGVGAGDIACFAAASGPGSFTGVRVGLACAKGLAEACGKPAVAVSNLQAMAAFGTGSRRAVVMDARRGEVYGGLYDGGGAPIVQEIVSPLTAWLERLPEAELGFVTLDVELPLAGTRFENAAVARAPQSIAAAVAGLALERFLRGEASDPAALDANYVRRSDAELFWKEL